MQISCTACVHVFCVGPNGVKARGLWLTIIQNKTPTNQQFLHEEFPSGFRWETKERHKLSITEGSRLLFEFEHTRLKCTTVSTSQLLISLYTIRAVWTHVRGWHIVCAEFLRPEIGTGWGYRGKCALRQQPWSRLPFGPRFEHIKANDKPYTQPCITGIARRSCYIPTHVISQ